MVRALLSEVNAESRSQSPKSEHGSGGGDAALSATTYYPRFGFIRRHRAERPESAHFRAVGHDVRVSSPEEPAERDVLSSLPRTRPQRRSAKRDGAARAGGAGAPKRPAKPRATKATAGTSTPRNAASKAAAKPASKPAGGAPKRAASAPKPPPARPQPADPPRSVEPPSRTDVLAGTVQAAGELVQAGLAVGGELVRAALSRLPRP